MNNLKKEFYKKFVFHYSEAVDIPANLVFDWIEKVIKEEYKRGYAEGWSDAEEDHEYNDMTPEDQVTLIATGKLEGNLVDRVSKEEPTTKCFKCGRIYKAKEIGCCFND